MKKMTKLIAVLAILIMTLALTGCSKTIKVNMEPYISVTYSGYNGNGMAKFDFDYADFEYEIMSQWDNKKGWEKLGELTALEMTINCEPASIEGLRNGDTVTVTMTVDEEKAKELGYSFSGTKKTFTVEGLTDAIMIDPFDESIMDIVIEGTSPFATLTLNYVGSRTAPEAYITYMADNQYDLANGDTVTITASMSEKYTQQGYLLTRNEMTVTVDGLQSYITDVSVLSADDVSAIQQKISEYYESQKTNGLKLHTAHGKEYNMTPEEVGSYGELRFADSGYAVVQNGWSTTAAVLIPFHLDVQDVSFYWWDGDFYDDQLVKSFTDMSGYFVVSDLLLDKNGQLIKEGSFGIEMSYLFENEQMMMEHIAERYDSDNLHKGTFAG